MGAAVNGPDTFAAAPPDPEGSADVVEQSPSDRPAGPAGTPPGAGAGGGDRSGSPATPGAVAEPGDRPGPRAHRLSAAFPQAPELTVGVDRMLIAGTTLQRGDLLMLAEEDYLYGTGEVHLSVRLIFEVQTHADFSRWVTVSGWQRNLIGPAQPRLVQVRVAALRTCIRRRSPPPDEAAPGNPPTAEAP